MRLLMLTLLLLLAGCGQKGPLYFPDQAAAYTPAPQAAHIDHQPHSYERRA